MSVPIISENRQATPGAFLGNRGWCDPPSLLLFEVGRRMTGYILMPRR
jgi:hypothetical protein